MHLAPLTASSVTTHYRSPQVLISRLALLAGVCVCMASCVRTPESQSVQLSLESSRPLDRLPLSFQPNRNQPEHPAKFIARHPAYTMLLAADHLELLFPNPRGNRDSRLEMNFLGANPASQVSAEEPLQGRVTYLTGQNTEDWITDIPTYAKVRVKEIYPGIDLVFYGNPKQLEWDFIVSPGANPGRIRIAFSRRPEVDRDGNLVLDTPSGTVTVKRPVAYQLQDNSRREVPVHYQRLARHEVGFRLDQYETDHPLVIDPVVVYSSYWGGAQGDAPSAVASDAQGNIYLAGTTESIDFPIRTPAVQANLKARRDIFVTKLSSAGDSILYSTYLGGTGLEELGDIAVDDEGNVYLAGTTGSDDFPTQNAVQPNYGSGGSDAFIAKLNPAGSRLVYATFLGGTRDESARAIAIDPDKGVSVVGVTTSSDFPVAGPVQSEHAGRSDAFAVRLDSTGSTLVYSTFLGGSRNDDARAVALDGQGNTYVVGATDSPDFPMATPFQETPAGSGDLFILKLDATGSALLFSTYLGGRRADVPAAAILNREDTLVIAGDTSSEDFPLLNPIQSNLAGSADIFLLQFKPDGSGLISSTVLGGASTDSVRDLKLDPLGNVYLTGATVSADFPTLDSLLLRGSGPDAIVTKLDPSLSTLLYSTYLKSDGTAIAEGIAVDPAGNAYVVGMVDLPDFPIVNALQEDFGGKGIFFSADRAVTWTGSGDGLSNRNIRVLQFDPTDPSILYAGTAGGLFRSSDAAKTWGPAGLEFNEITSIVVDPTDSRTIYACSVASVFKTTDGGEEWESINTNLPFFPSFTELAIDPRDSSILYVGTNGRGVFKTTTGGEQWRAINGGLNGPAQQVFAVAVDPKDSNRLFIGTLGAVYTSTNGGDFWRITNLKDISAVFSLAIHPAGGNTLYAAASSQFGDLLAHTTDGGATWKAQPVEATLSVLALDPLGGSAVYAATLDKGVLKSDDLGVSWKEFNSGLNSRRVNSLIVHPNLPANMYAGTESGSDGFLVKIAPLRTFYLPQLGDGRQGQLRFQTTVILLNTGEDTTARLEFFDSSGQPMPVALGSLGNQAAFDIPLGAGQAFSAQTRGEGGIQVGYARVTTSDRVGGTAVFTRSDAFSGLVLYEAGVPAVTSVSSFSLFLDSLEDQDTGLAVVNASQGELNPTGEAELNFTLLDKDANLIGTSQLTLSQVEHRAQFIREIFPEIAGQVGEMRGVLQVRSNQPVAALTMRQKEDPRRIFPQWVPTLTAFPVVRSHNLQNVFYFPQVADGPFAKSRFQTGFVFVNAGSLAASLTVEMFDSQGQPLELNLGDLGQSSVFEFSLGPRRFLAAQTPGEGDFRVGYAKVTSSSPGVGGTVIFAETHQNGEVTLYETGVPAAVPLREFSLFVDTLGSRDTGLALVNPATEPAELTVRLYDKSFVQRGEGSLSLPPGGHLARFAWEFFPQIQGIAREMEGVLTVESTLPLAAVTLRQNKDITRDFPLQVPTLTAFPVVPGRSE